jgi:hypothetical protein
MREKLVPLLWLKHYALVYLAAAVLEEFIDYEYFVTTIYDALAGTLDPMHGLHFVAGIASLGTEMLIGWVLILGSLVAFQEGWPRGRFVRFCAKVLLALPVFTLVFSFGVLGLTSSSFLNVGIAALILGGVALPAVILLLFLRWRWQAGVSLHDAFWGLGGARRRPIPKQTAPTIATTATDPADDAPG